MIGGVHEAWCYVGVSSLWHTVWPNCVCDVAVPCGFARPPPAELLSTTARAIGPVLRNEVIIMDPIGFFFGPSLKSTNSSRPASSRGLK